MAGRLPFDGGDAVETGPSGIAVGTALNPVHLKGPCDEAACPAKLHDGAHGGQLAIDTRRRKATVQHGTAVSVQALVCLAHASGEQTVDGFAGSGCLGPTGEMG